MTTARGTISRRSLLKATSTAGAAIALPNVARKTRAAQEQTLSYWTAGDTDASENETQQAYIQSVADATGITLEIRNIPFAQFDSVSQSALAAGEGPDLLSVNSVTVGAFIERGYLLPTGDYLEASTAISQDDFFEGLFGHVVYKDQVYGLPVDTGTRALYYNIAMLEEKGVAPPQSIEELTAALPLLTDPDNAVYGITYSGGERWVWLYEAIGMLTVPNGHDFISDDLATPLMAAEVMPDLQWWIDVHNNGWAAEENISSTDGNERITQFSQGRAATAFLGHWARESLIENEAPEFGVVNLQGAENIGSSTGGWTMMITKDASDPDLAWSVMESTFGAPEVLATLTGLMPATKAANALVLTDAFYEPFKEVLEVNAKHPILLNAALPEMAEILRSESQAAVLGAKSIDDAAEEIDKQFMDAIQNFA